MALIETISEGLMALVQRYAPDNRQEFVRAMQKEFTTLQGGRLSWALGCLSAVVQWQATAAARFCIALVVIGIVFSLVQGMPLMLIYAVTPAAFVYVYWLLAPALVCAALAAWKPRYAGLGAVGLFLLLNLMDLTIGMTMRQPLPHDWHILDAPPIVGWSAQLAWCAAGAWCGLQAAKWARHQTA